MRGHFRRLVTAFVRRAGIGAGLRWKLSAAIALVGALVAVALSLVVHNAARVSMLDNARDLADERIMIAQRNYELSGRLNFPNTKIDDPQLPAELRAKVEEGRRATYVADRGGAPDIWAAVPLKNGHVMSLHSGFTDRSSDILKDLDQALWIGSLATVLGGCALGVLIGGHLSRRLRKAATAANRVAGGETDVRVREAIGGVMRDETDDLASAVDAMADALRQRLEAERRVTADIAHELRTPVTGLLTAAELLPPGRPTELVQDRARAMRTLVEDVLEVARLDSASERAELQDILLGEFVARRVAAKDPAVIVRVDARVGGHHRPAAPGTGAVQPARQRGPARGPAHRGHRGGPGGPGPRPRARLPGGPARRGTEPLPHRQRGPGGPGSRPGPHHRGRPGPRAGRPAHLPQRPPGGRTGRHAPRGRRRRPVAAGTRPDEHGELSGAGAVSGLPGHVTAPEAP